MENKNIPEDLSLLKSKIDQAKERKTKKTHSPKFVSASGLGFRSATDLLAAVVVGGAIGYVFDNMWGTKPIMLVIFLLLGGAAGFLNVYRIVKNIEK